MKRLLLSMGALVVLVIAGAIGYSVARRTPSVANTATAKPERKVLYWYDPMVPQQHFDHSGLSPMGMQMVPRYANEPGSATSSGGVRIDPAVLQNLGVRTTVVKIGTLQRSLNVPATITWNLDESATVSARTAGVIDKLYVPAPFTEVKAGQPLAELLSPEWNAAAQEYLALGNAQSSDARSLRDAARERLRALGMTEVQIHALRNGSADIVLHAPADGVVSALDVRQGQQVATGTPLMTINGLDTVWLDAAIPQGQIAGIGAGTPVTATVSALPDETFLGKVEQLLPDVDPATRTQRARIVLDNPKYELAPGMFAEVRIQGAAGAAYPLVPTEALISTGSQSRVIVATSDGHFEPVAVRVGASSDGMSAILAGVHGGERVVTSGQFLIDSEASLSGALERLSAPASSSSAGNSGATRSSSSTSSSREKESHAMPGMAMPPASSTQAPPPSSTSAGTPGMPMSSSSGVQP